MNARKDWTDARWGQFAYGPIEGVTVYRCGVCRVAYDYPHEKAEHLIKAHNARVALAPGDLYEWSRS